MPYCIRGVNSKDKVPAIEEEWKGTAGNNISFEDSQNKERQVKPNKHAEFLFTSERPKSALKAQIYHLDRDGIKVRDEEMAGAV